MSCRRVRKLVSISLDGPPSQRGRNGIDEHLRQCPDCRRFREQLQALTSELELLTVPDPRPGFAGRTLARLPGKSRHLAFVDRLLEFIQPAPAALGTAALVLGVFLAISMNGYGSDSGTTDPTEALFAESLDLTPADSIGERYLSLLAEVED
ncbi:MAG: zf-HC2 domain-containing protein [Phycisphaerales bacterium]|nr:MAG: zf-HC2 domain-containing protein [Phycisphaerales bacterium]